MKDSIIVSVSELRAAVQDARRTGKNYVRLSILDGVPAEEIPASVTLSVFDPSDDPVIVTDVADVYAVEDESDLSSIVASANHTNLVWI